MLTITFTIMGDVVLARGLSRFGDGIKDFSPAWNQILADFLRIEGEQFETEGHRAQRPWTPLSPTYAAWKEKNFPGRPILQLTGALWSQMTVGTGLNVSIHPLELRMQPTAYYALFHQQGTATMPARKVVDLTEEDKMGWMKILHNYVYDTAKRERLL